MPIFTELKLLSDKEKKMLILLSGISFFGIIVFFIYRKRVISKVKHLDFLREFFPYQK